MMSSIHEPTPEFDRYLEWQVRTALRRQDRFARPARSGVRAYAGAAAIVAVSMLVGAAGVAASSRLQDDQQKQLLLTQEQVDLQLAQLQLSMAQKAAQDAQARVAAGIILANEAAGAQRGVQTAQLNLRRAQLDIEEVRQSGQPVQDDLTAPLVGKQDFVLERLALDEQAAAVSASAAQQDLEAARKRFDLGLATQVQVLDAQSELMHAAADLQTAQQKMELRRQFVGGQLTAQEASRRRLLLAAQNQLRAAEADLQAASQRYAWIQAQFKTGGATEEDLLKAQLDMLGKTKDLDLLRAHIATLQHGGGGEPNVGPGGR